MNEKGRNPHCKEPAKVVGGCDGYFPSYSFNSTSKRCESFIYGGCGGNNNRFETIQQCISACKPKNR
ncbi:hypothetical protein B4U80_06719 [Leptotrombidium deliense]|uniref:BPTI/Kunitz inhibitor domain-containing protein n=1 Tax=Leptotrombidium deliense TaxID=299467 RepID=A0A443S787_9ACAR|nr:hypothetical protein B4U80_06719 [Leptotrombidium deliense]